MAIEICLLLFCYVSMVKAVIEDPYTECDTHFCFGFSPANKNCVKDKNCKLFVKIILDQKEGEESDSELVFKAHMTDVKIHSSSVWMGIGLSDDEEMGDDAVVDCFTVGYNQAQVRSSMNLVISRTKSNQHVSNERVHGIRYTSRSFVDGTLSCQWSRTKYSNITGQDRDPETFEFVGELYHKTINFVDNSYFVLLAHGLLIPGSLSKQAHAPKSRAISPKNPFFNIFFVSCEETSSITSKYCFGVDILRDGTVKPCVKLMRCHLSVIVRTFPNENNFLARISDIKHVNIEGESSGVYLAVGLSFDMKMGDDSVTECLFHANRSSDIKDTFNMKRGKNVPADKPFSTPKTAITFDTIIECEWKRPFEVEHNGADFSTNKNAFYLIVAVGQLGSNSGINGKKKHVQTFTSMNAITFGDFHDLEQGEECEESKSSQCSGFRENAAGNKGRTSDELDRCIIDTNCLLRLKTLRIKNGYQFTITGRVGFGYWIAFGLSIDEKMGDDVVFECAAAANGTLQGVSWNPDKSNTNAEIVDGITLTEATFKRNKLSCKFEVNKQFTISVDGSKKTIFLKNDDFEYNILFAYGKVLKNNDQKGIPKEPHNVNSRGVSIVKFHHLDSLETFENLLEVKGNHWLLYILVILAFTIIISAVALIFLLKKRSNSQQIESVPAPLNNDEPSIRTIDSVCVTKPRLSKKSAISTKTQNSGKSSKKSVLTNP